jgi:hypothetical protein
VPRPPVAPLAAEDARGRVDERAAEPERERAVESAADERPDRDDEPIHPLVVEQPAGDGSREDGRDPREPDQREQRLLPRARGVVGVVPQRCEDRPRSLQHEQRPQQPLAFG